MSHHALVRHEARRDPGDHWHHAACSCGWETKPYPGDAAIARALVARHAKETGHIGHVLSGESTGDLLQNRAVCACGWSGPWWQSKSPTLWPDIGADKTEHLHDVDAAFERARERSHDLEVVESGIFLRAECSCGDWQSEKWHPKGYAMTWRYLKSEHHVHTFRLAQEARA